MNREQMKEELVRDLTKVGCSKSYARRRIEEFMDSYRKELVEKVEERKLGGHRDEEKKIYAGGYDEALSDAISLITQETK